MISVDMLDMKNSKGYSFCLYCGGNRLEMCNVAIIADAKKVAQDTHLGFSGIPSKNNFYRLKVKKDTTGNNS